MKKGVYLTKEQNNLYIVESVKIYEDLYSKFYITKGFSEKFNFNKLLIRQNQLKHLIYLGPFEG